MRNLRKDVSTLAKEIIKLSERIDHDHLQAGCSHSYDCRIINLYNGTVICGLCGTVICNDLLETWAFLRKTVEEKEADTI